MTIWRLIPGTCSADFIQGNIISSKPFKDSKQSTLHSTNVLSYSNNHLSYRDYILSITSNPKLNNSSTAIRIPPNGNLNEKYLHNNNEMQKSCWCYAHLWQMTQDLNILLGLMLELGCNSKSCPSSVGKNSNNIRCSSHKNIKNCLPFLYACHSLTTAEDLLCNPMCILTQYEIPFDIFPVIFQSLYQIFVHAWLYHPTAFVKFEIKTSAYKRAVILAKCFNLLPFDSFVIPLVENETELNNIIYNLKEIDLALHLQNNPQWLHEVNQKKKSRTKTLTLEDTDKENKP